MSRWTHVAGVVRIDTLPIFGETDWLAYFGKEFHYDSSIDIWREQREHPERFLPGGSEGSLHSSLWENPDKNCTAGYTVMIFGDLRDYDTPEEIIRWFKEKINGIPLVRQAVISVELEYSKPITWNYAEEKVDTEE